MSLFAVLLILVIAAAILSSAFYFQKTKAAQSLLGNEKAARITLEEKFNSLKKENSALREDLNRKTKMLDEARDVARKKLRKEAIKATGEIDAAMKNSNEDSEVNRLKSALEAIKEQLRTVQSQGDRALHQIQMNAKNEFDEERMAFKEEIARLNELLIGKKQESEKQKRSLKQTLPSIDVESLSDDLTKEIARLLRKSENYEKMHAVSQGKLQMAIERFTEMQRRYFAVCRELALAVGSEPSLNEEETRNIAEDIVAASETSVLSTAELHPEVFNIESNDKHDKSNGVTS